MVAERLERYFRKRLVANYDRLMAPLERRVLGEARRRLLGLCSGTVLEIGAGTGVNFERYGAGVRRVVAVDPELGMLGHALARASSARAPLALVGASAESLPFPGGTFDTVVATLVFCTIARPEVAMSEVSRVLKPGGLLLMLEHVRSRSAILGAVQDALTPIQRIVAAGCHLNRPTQSLVGDQFALAAVRERFASTLVEIEAVRAV